MKTLIALCLTLIGSVAYADTIGLDQSNCGATRYCTTVYNDADPAIGVTISANPASPAVIVYVDGVAYRSDTGNAPGTLNTPVTVDGLVLTNDVGTSVTLSATFYGVRKLHRSGHNYWSTQWVLLSGEIVRP